MTVECNSKQFSVIGSLALTGFTVKTMCTEWWVIGLEARRRFELCTPPQCRRRRPSAAARRRRKRPPRRLGGASEATVVHTSPLTGFLRSSKEKTGGKQQVCCCLLSLTEIWKIGFDPIVVIVSLILIGARRKRRAGAVFSAVADEHASFRSTPYQSYLQYTAMHDGILPDNFYADFFE